MLIKKITLITLCVRRGEGIYGLRRSWFSPFILAVIIIIKIAMSFVCLLQLPPSLAPFLCTWSTSATFQWSNQFLFYSFSLHSSPPTFLYSNDIPQKNSKRSSSLTKRRRVSFVSSYSSITECFHICLQNIFEPVKLVPNLAFILFINTHK